MKRDKALNLLSLALIIASSLITIISSGYSVLRADDFGHAASIGIHYSSADEMLKTSFSFAKDIYDTWQGTYFSMFLQALLSPLNHSGLSFLRPVMVCNAVLFFLSLILFLWVFLKKEAENEKPMSLVVIAVVLLCFMNLRTYTEIFYWYSGITSYCFPLSSLLAALALSRKGKLNKPLMVLCCFLLLLAGGGTLMISGGSCYALLLFLYEDSRREGKLNKQDLILFLAAFAGALINAAAPGNYIRHSVIDSKIRITAALGFSLKAIIRDILYMITQTPLQFFCAILLLIACNEWIKLRKLRKDTLLFLHLLPVVVSFPLTLGYSDSYLPNRCMFLLDLSLILVFGYDLILLGNHMAERTRKADRLVITCIAACGAFIGIRHSVPQIEVLKELCDGSYAEYYMECKRVYDYLDSSEEKEVILNDFPEEIDNIAGFNLKEDPEYYANISAASWYQKDCIIAITRSGS